MRNTLVLITAGWLFCHLVMAQNYLIIAHRGASHEAPENTLAAVNLAWEKGADAVEVDVHLSRDLEIMVIHDKDTRRTTGEKHVVKVTGSDVLRSLDAGRIKNERFAGEQIPFLEEVLNTIPPGKKLFVEIKSDERIISYLEAVVKSHEKSTQVVLIGFDFKTMEKAKKRMPDLPVFWLHSSATGGYRHSHIERAKAAGLDGLNFHYRGLRKGYIDSVHAAGMEMYTWTVDDPQVALRLIKSGIDGITTNRPGWLRENLSIH
jgi:glycerophosphoryl diester phosphodiesterase